MVEVVRGHTSHEICHRESLLRDHPEPLIGQRFHDAAEPLMP